MCMFCKNTTTKKSVTTFTASLDNCVIIIKNVPCEECEQCGEKYFSDEVMAKLEKFVQKAKALASEVFVTEFEKMVA
ncbi:MAG: type II toxin-antitoxin system MqsA family antitoxin [Fibrobacteraceae bacterium]|nr:type II toxin-antitoxin system MqsA family antitoxin [Fibrobacteraceae bacterium]